MNNNHTFYTGLNQVLYSSQLRTVTKGQWSRMWLKDREGVRFKISYALFLQPGTEQCKINSTYLQHRSCWTVWMKNCSVVTQIEYSETNTRLYRAHLLVICSTTRFRNRVPGSNYPGTRTRFQVLSKKGKRQCNDTYTPNYRIFFYRAMFIFHIKKPVMCS